MERRVGVNDATGKILLPRALSLERTGAGMRRAQHRIDAPKARARLLNALRSRHSELPLPPPGLSSRLGMPNEGGV